MTMHTTTALTGRNRIRAGAVAIAAGALLAASIAPAAAEPSREAPQEDQIDAAAWETLIDGDSFADREALESEWNYLYPWGSDHNGTARMYAGSTDDNHLYLSSGGVLNIKATRIDWDEGSSSQDPYLPIRYHSAAIHAKDQILVNDEFPTWEVRGEFQAPSAPGTWPAFWITGANSWPPESDILEYKGDNRNWFNTYDGGWDNTLVAVDDPGAWHEYGITITKVDDADVQIDYYLDGNLQATHIGSDFVGQPMDLIINLQMEGSSGSSGPEGDTYYKARNVYVARSGDSTGTGTTDIVNRNSGRCLDVAGGSTADGVEIIQWGCHGEANQQWRLVDVGGGYHEIVSRSSGKCLDVEGASTGDGARAIQWQCNGGFNQQWELRDAGNGQVELVARHSGKCLDVDGGSTADGGVIRQSTCSNVHSQQWALAVP